MKTTCCRNFHLPSIFWLVVLGTQLSGCHERQLAPPAPTPCEQQKLKDEQRKTQQKMNTLTSGVGQSLSKTPAAPVTDPAADWKKSHPQKQSLTTKPQTQSQPQPQPQPQPPSPPSSKDKSKQ